LKEKEWRRGVIDVGDLHGGKVSYLLRFDTESSEIQGCPFQVGTTPWMESPYGIKFGGGTRQGF